MPKPGGSGDEAKVEQFLLGERVGRRKSCYWKHCFLRCALEREVIDGAGGEHEVFAQAWALLQGQEDLGTLFALCSSSLRALSFVIVTLLVA